MLLPGPWPPSRSCNIENDYGSGRSQSKAVGLPSDSFAEKLFDCPWTAFTLLNAAPQAGGIERNETSRRFWRSHIDNRLILWQMRDRVESRDTHSCSAEQGNPVQNRNTVGMARCAVSTEPSPFPRKRVIGET